MLATLNLAHMGARNPRHGRELVLSDALGDARSAHSLSKG